MNGKTQEYSKEPYSDDHTGLGEHYITPSDYVFLPDQERSLEYLNDEGITDASARESIDGWWGNRANAMYMFDSKKTIFFLYNETGRSRGIHMTYRLLKGIPYIDGLISSALESSLSSDFVHIFNHEYLHEIIDKFIGQDLGAGKTTRLDILSTWMFFC